MTPYTRDRSVVMQEMLIQAANLLISIGGRRLINIEDPRVVYTYLSHALIKFISCQARFYCHSMKSHT